MTRRVKCSMVCHGTGRSIHVEPSARCTLTDLLKGRGKSSSLLCGCNIHGDGGANGVDTGTQSRSSWMGGRGSSEWIPTASEFVDADKTNANTSLPSPPIVSPSLAVAHRPPSPEPHPPGIKHNRALTLWVLVDSLVAPPPAALSVLHLLVNKGLPAACALTRRAPRAFVGLLMQLVTIRERARGLLSAVVVDEVKSACASSANVSRSETRHLCRGPCACGAACARLSGAPRVHTLGEVFPASVRLGHPAAVPGQQHGHHWRGEGCMQAYGAAGLHAAQELRHARGRCPSICVLHAARHRGGRPAPGGQFSMTCTPAAVCVFHHRTCLVGAVSAGTAVAFLALHVLVEEGLTACAQTLGEVSPAAICLGHHSSSVTRRRTRAGAQPRRAREADANL
ncbi:hypothetical protein GGX14DRAFT_385504 [Mycena pura]|uniref:Uncharacterized protein n=1 Tax=Mycena pura TaxID=153505 RepID=A0AAD7E3E4_9AGAR|nr:hypothetical protein GGX14DRAFT_385504 [Mycena pura]